MTYILVALLLVVGYVQGASNATTARPYDAKTGLNSNATMANKSLIMVPNATITSIVKANITSQPTAEVAAKPTAATRSGTASNHVHDGKTVLMPSSSIGDKPTAVIVETTVQKLIGDGAQALATPSTKTTSSNATLSQTVVTKPVKLATPNATINPSAPPAGATKKPLVDDYPSMHTKPPVLTPKPASKVDHPARAATPAPTKKRGPSRSTKPPAAKTKRPRLIDKASDKRKGKNKRNDDERRSPASASKPAPEVDAYKNPPADSKRASPDDSRGSDRSDAGDAPMKPATKKDGDAAPAGGSIDKAQVQSLFGGMSAKKEPEPESQDDQSDTNSEVEVTNGEPAKPSNQARSMFTGIAGGLMGGGGKAKSGMGLF